MSWSVKLENIGNRGNTIGLKELKQIELNILKAFHMFCEDHGLTYFLAGGTLLGAVRHQGFIPWDDDIDVLMPRPDYFKFLELTKEGLGEYTVRSIQTHPELHTRPFMRIHDERYMTKLTVPPFYMPPWIDIFPIDGMPDDPAEAKKYFKRAKKYKTTVARAWIPIKYQTKNKLKRIIKSIVFFPLRIIGHHYFLKRLESYGLQYSYESSEYVGCVVAGGHGYKERVKKSEFCVPVLMKFEDSMFYAPAGYHVYLQQLYGNYMKIPKKTKSYTHLDSVWEITNQEKVGKGGHVN